MPDLISGTEKIPKDRLVTIICLIMIIEHLKLNLEEIIQATGMTFGECRSAMQNLVNVKLVSVHPTDRGIPYFKLIDEKAANEYYKFANEFNK